MADTSKHRHEAFQIRVRIAIIGLIVLLGLLLSPDLIAERYTSPTLDGQFLLHPVTSYGYLFALIRAGNSAKVGTPGKALDRAKSLFSKSDTIPVRVSLLYLDDRKSYSYATRSGTTLKINSPPSLVWEIWGRARADAGSPMTQSDIVGYLDYRTGALLTTEIMPPATAR